MATLLRKNIDHLSSAELAALRKGYAAMQAVIDNRGFNAIAGYHDAPRKLCYHHEDEAMFLPWHRGYLITFEQFLRDHNAALALPYWDWTSPTSHATGVPVAFSATKQPGGQRNPLHDSTINVPMMNPPTKRRTRRFAGPPAELPAPATIRALLRESDYTAFSRRLQGVHDEVHGWTGGQNASGVPGDMAMTTFAAFDPVFYSHHCMIDRIWARWQELYGVTNIPAPLRKRALRGFDNLTVESVLDIAQLGYGYASDEVVLAISP
jgi:tyrosinase